MTFYLVLLSSLMTVGILLKHFFEDITDDIIFVGLSFFTLSIVSAIRFDVGLDYLYIYTPAFNKIANSSFNEVFFDEQRHEFGYVLLQYLVTLFTDDFRAIFFVTTIIIIGLVCLFYYKYAYNNVMAIYLFTCFGLFYSSMNFIRQNIAAILVSFAFLQIKEKNLINYCLLIFLAGLFHKSAFFLLPFYFILQIKLNLIIFAIYSLITGLICVFSGNILYFAVETFFPWYLDSVSINFIELGIAWYYLIIPVTSFIFLFVFQHFFCNVNETNYILVNTSFFYMFFFILGTKYFIIERFSIFFAYSTILGIVNLLYCINYNYKTASSKSYNYGSFKFKFVSFFINFIVIIFALCFNLLLLYRDGHSVVPYTTFFDDLYQSYMLVFDA